MTLIIRSFAFLSIFFIIWSTTPIIAKADAVSPEANLSSITIHHKVSTKDPLAQSLFDSALQSFYAFDLEQANQRFQQAAVQQPTLAMAYWGLAMSSIPDIHQPIDSQQYQVSYEAIQKANELAVSSTISLQDKDYIAVLNRRYSPEMGADPKKQMLNYLNGLKELMHIYPNDPDVATLYAEGLMDLQGWKLWTRDKQPIGATPEIIALLKSVLKQYPNHLGANHYYIHAMEYSDHPEVTLISAQRLKSQANTSKHLRNVVDNILKKNKVEY